MNRLFSKNKNRYKGYTLIELIAVMAIIAIVLAFCSIGGKWYKHYMNGIDTSYTSDSILFFITNSKQYCREKESKGCITFDVIENKIIFSSNGLVRDEFLLPCGYTLNGTNLPINEINIDNSGFSSDACTIKFRDREEKLHSITMCVGTAYVEIKD